MRISNLRPSSQFCTAGRMSRMGDRRVILIDEIKVAAVINYKCGYATLNNYINIDENIKSHNPKSIVDILDINYRKVIFFRDPYERFVSFYKGWIANSTEQSLLSRGKKNYYKLIKDFGGKNLYEKFCRANAIEKMNTEMFEDFIGICEPFYKDDRHTVPQSDIYRRHGLTVELFDEKIPTRQTTKFIYDNFGTSVKPRNVTNSNIHKEILNNRSLIEFCDRHYQNDFIDFEIPTYGLRHSALRSP